MRIGIGWLGGVWRRRGLVEAGSVDEVGRLGVGDVVRLLAKQADERLVLVAHQTVADERHG
eukprot:scaffold90737_cov63-Phaeocystis_antarctica.AAC.1